jgi:ribosomal protein S18 acetylase RimI-like enzyme
MNVSIRTADLADEEAVVAIWRACGLTTAYNDPVADFRLAVAGSASTVLVAKTGIDVVVGTVMVGHDGHRGWLYYVAADPAHQRKGIGRTVVAAGESWLRDRAIAKVQLMVREENASVTQFYAQLGFEETPRILMAKWLKAPETQLVSRSGLP